MLTNFELSILLKASLFEYVPMESGGASLFGLLPLGGNQILSERVQKLINLELSEEAAIDIYNQYISGLGDTIKKLELKPGTYQVVDTNSIEMNEYLKIEEYFDETNGCWEYRNSILKNGFVDAIKLKEVAVSASDIDLARKCLFEIFNQEQLSLAIRRVNDRSKKDQGRFLHSYPTPGVDGKRPDGRTQFPLEFHEKMYLIFQALVSHGELSRS